MRAAASRSCASLARRSVRKRLVLSASICWRARLAVSCLGLTGPFICRPPSFVGLAGADTGTDRIACPLLHFRAVIGGQSIRRALRVGPLLEAIRAAIGERNAHVEAICFIYLGANTWELIFDLQGGIDRRANSTAFREESIFK